MYEGDYKRGLKHGDGKLTFEDNSFYQGSFMNDNFEGFGIY